MSLTAKLLYLASVAVSTYSYLEISLSALMVAVLLALAAIEQDRYASTIETDW